MYTHRVYVVILAGGFGTRVATQAGHGPKFLIDIEGIPFGHRQLHLWRAHGANAVLLLTGAGHAAIAASVGDGARFGLKITTLRDERPGLGTAGALVAAHRRGALARPFLLTYGDSYLLSDPRALWQTFVAKGAPACMAVWQNHDALERSNVEITDGDRALYGRAAHTPTYIDYGVTAVHPRLLDDHALWHGTTALTEVFVRLSEGGRLAAHRVRERFYEVGSPAGLADFRAYVRARSTRRNCP